MLCRALPERFWSQLLGVKKAFRSANLAGRVADSNGAMSHEREGRYRESGGADTQGADTELAPGKRTVTQALETPRRASAAVPHLVQRRLRKAPSFEPGVDLDAPPIADGLAAAFLAPPSPVQARAVAAGVAEPEQVHAAAERGAATPSTSLPYRPELEASLGQDLSGVQAHVGGAAESAAGDMGAEAFATGDHVVLPANPSMHTVAHEVAHVLQQRDGVQLKGGVGEEGDSYEQHADAVADRVVRGAAVGSHSGSSDAPARGAGIVQMRPAGTADDTAEDAHYEPSWDEIVAASQGDSDAMDALDIAWIDGLPGDLASQIDRSFHVSKEHAVVALLKKKRLAAIDAKYKRDVGTLDKEARARLGKKAKLKEDDAYKDARRVLDDEHAANAQSAEQEAKAEAAGGRRKVEATSTAVATSDKELPWMQGRLLARVNFVAWGTYLLGSTAKLKAHYQGVQSVPGASSIVLSGEATARFVAARAWFEAKFPGNTFLRRGGGLQIRNRHQGDHSRGKLGHPLGIAVDFDATANPHQKDAVAQFMLRQFGGKRVAGTDEHEEGSNRMDLPDKSFSTVEDMGQATEEGDALTKRQIAFLAQAHAAYTEMFETSERFRASLADQMPALRAAQAAYLGVMRPGQERLHEISKELTRLRRKKNAANEAKIATLVNEQAQLAATVGAVHAGVTSTMLAAFAPWLKEMQGFVDSAKEKHGDDLSMKVDAAAANALVPRILDAKKPKQLRELLSPKSKYKVIFADLDADLIDQDFDFAKREMAERAKAVGSARRAAAGVWFRQELIERLTADPVAVFGTGSDQVADPSVMQYLEKGFVRHDELNKPNDGVDDNKVREVFNGEFMQAMLMHGWYTGAAWNSSVDTMHFDFLEGYAAIVGDGGSDKLYGPTD
jgi:hypothetical protein